MAVAGLKLRWTGPALQDLRDASDFIARDRPGAADDVVGRLFEAAESLLEYPERGRVHPETGLRLLPVRRTSMMLVYEIADGAILIYEVRHMARRPFADPAD